ncbi:hypothetical protein EGW08_008271 [Elysia chlorotica]|uniref:Uncharacterized protein n=1 Tax=Elysia chlorotica TaxID=188477 RepID=A0A3S0ZVI8_ELYCH|nr:hypothetical protein EGW08_008271 [Elysia chlorotica]
MACQSEAPNGDGDELRRPGDDWTYQCQVSQPIRTFPPISHGQPGALNLECPWSGVLIIQLRRAKREEAERRLAEERARRGGGSTSDGGESGTFDSPPTYEQLFGPDHSPSRSPPVIPSRHNSLDMLIERGPGPRVGHCDRSLTWCGFGAGLKPEPGGGRWWHGLVQLPTGFPGSDCQCQAAASGQCDTVTELDSEIQLLS